MSITHSCFEPTDDPAAAWAGDVVHFRAELRALADVAGEMARMALEQARAREMGLAEASVMVERVSRTARRCMLLAQRLGEPLGTPGAVAGAARPGAGVKRAVARRRVLREVEDSIVLQAGPEDVERLRGEMLERLDAPELEDEIGVRPVGEIIAEIRRDLGLSGRLAAEYWNRRTPAAVSALCARAAAGPGERTLRGGAWSSGGWEEPAGDGVDLSQMTDAELAALETREMRAARWRVRAEECLE